MDVTELPTGAGKVDLAVVLDAFSRRVVGWSIADLDIRPAAERCRPVGLHGIDRGLLLQQRRREPIDYETAHAA